MKSRWIISAAAIALLTASGSASAYTIDILQSTHSSVTPAAPAGFNLLPFGTGTANSFQGSGPIGVGGVTFTFTGGDFTGSGLYAGNASGQFASPFGSGNSTSNYLVAQGNGGLVTATWTTPQTELAILWGTVDQEQTRNLVTGNGNPIETISGNDVRLQMLADLLPFANGEYNVYLRISGLNPFTTVTFADSQGQSPAFEFALAAPVPFPIAGAGLPGLLVGCGALLVALRRRRRQKCA